MPRVRPILIEFPADDPERARRFWGGLLGAEPRERAGDEGSGEAFAGAEAGCVVGLHARGGGPGDRNALPYFAADDLEAAVALVVELGGSVVHAGPRTAICRDSEGSPFGLQHAGA